MESKRVILDSNIFIALYYTNDTFHEKACSLMEGLLGASIFVPYCVIQEVTTILCYRFGKEKSNLFLADLRKSEDVIILDNNAEAEIDFYLKIKRKLSFTDISLLHLSQKYDAMLFTFDRQLLNLYKRSH